MAPRQAVAGAIQDLVAARLGRAFVPAGLLFVAGLVELGVRGPSDGAALALAAGALASAGALLANGLRVVQQAFGRGARAWMTLARWVAAVPMVYGLYVLAWRGLRQLAVGDGLAGPALGILFAVLGTWVLRSWMRVVEVEALARVMTFDLDETGEEA